MIYNNIFNKKISQLGMGFTSHYNNSSEMVDYAISQGINYFEVASFYLNNQCETIAANALSKYSRDSYFLCDKISILKECYNPNFNINIFFEKQLKKCNTNYFDVYLLQGVNQNVLNYLKKNLYILDFFLQKKQEGKIHNFGFSFHDDINVLKEFFKFYNKWDIIQIQINFFDWYNGQAKDLYLFLKELNIPIIAMKPCKGGNLFSSFPEEIKNQINKNFYEISFNFLQQLSNIKIILTGASNITELKQNISYINIDSIFTKKDQELCKLIINLFKQYNYIPCTNCKYCEAICPKKIEIANMFKITNNIILNKEKEKNQIELTNITKIKHTGFYNCIACGQCEKICPQHLPIRDYFKIVRAFEL